MIEEVKEKILKQNSDMLKKKVVSLLKRYNLCASEEDLLEVMSDVYKLEDSYYNLFPFYLAFKNISRFELRSFFSNPDENNLVKFFAYVYSKIQDFSILVIWYQDYHPLFCLGMEDILVSQYRFIDWYRPQFPYLKFYSNRAEASFLVFRLKDFCQAIVEAIF